MIASSIELSEFTGLSQPAAIVRALKKLGAPAVVNAKGVPAVPLEWWTAFKAGQIRPVEDAIQQIAAANDDGHSNELRLDMLPRGRKKLNGTRAQER